MSDPVQISDPTEPYVKVTIEIEQPDGEKSRLTIWRAVNVNLDQQPVYKGEDRIWPPTPPPELKAVDLTLTMRGLPVHDADAADFQYGEIYRYETPEAPREP